VPVAIVPIGDAVVYIAAATTTVFQGARSSRIIYDKVFP